MLKIIVNEGYEHYEGEGATIELIAELDMAVEGMVKKLVEDAPSEIRPAVKSMIKMSLNLAVDKAFE